MKKYFFIPFALTIFLFGCTNQEKNTQDEPKVKEEVKAPQEVITNDEYKAKASDFRVGFSNQDNQLIGLDENGGVFIHATYSARVEGEELLTDIDNILKEKDIKSGERFEKTFPNATIKTEGSNYTIELEDGLVLKFEKIGLRIIKDSLGNRYSTSAYPE